MAKKKQSPFSDHNVQIALLGAVAVLAVVGLVLMFTLSSSATGKLVNQYTAWSSSKGVYGNPALGGGCANYALGCGAQGTGAYQICYTECEQQQRLR